MKKRLRKKLAKTDANLKMLGAMIDACVADWAGLVIANEIAQAAEWTKAMEEKYGKT